MGLLYGEEYIVIIRIWTCHSRPRGIYDCTESHHVLPNTKYNYSVTIIS